MIFISYSWKDAAAARYVATLLERQGQQIWIDYQNLNLAQPIAPQLSQAICKAKTFVLLDSVNARASDWVQFERSTAGILNKAILVVQLPAQNLGFRSSKPLKLA